MVRPVPLEAQREYRACGDGTPGLDDQMVRHRRRGKHRIIPIVELDQLGELIEHRDDTPKPDPDLPSSVPSDTTKETLVAEAFTHQMLAWRSILDEGLAAPEPWHGFCLVIEKLCEPPRWVSFARSHICPWDGAGQPFSTSDHD